MYSFCDKNKVKPEPSNAIYTEKQQAPMKRGITLLLTHVERPRTQRGGYGAGSAVRSLCRHWAYGSLVGGAELWSTVTSTAVPSAAERGQKLAGGGRRELSEVMMGDGGWVTAGAYTRQ